MWYVTRASTIYLLDLFLCARRIAITVIKSSIKCVDLRIYVSPEVSHKKCVDLRIYVSPEVSHNLKKSILPVQFKNRLCLYWQPILQASPI